MPTKKIIPLLLLTLTCTAVFARQNQAQPKSKLSLDEFFNSVSFPAVEISA